MAIMNIDYENIPLVKFLKKLKNVQNDFNI